MKISNIKDLGRFFEVVNECTGKVEVVSPEGDCIVLNSQLCRFVLASLIEKNDILLETLELKCEKLEDTNRIIKYLMEG